jgi:hypothetical protein
VFLRQQQFVTDELANTFQQQLDEQHHFAAAVAAPFASVIKHNIRKNSRPTSK